MNEKIINWLKLEDYQSLDSRLLHIILRLAPLTGLLVTAIYMIAGMEPKILVFPILIYSLLSFVVYLLNENLSNSTLKYLSIGLLYSLIASIWYINLGITNQDYYLFGIGMFLSILLFRNSHLKIFVFNTFLVVSLTYFHQYGMLGNEISESLAFEFESIRFNYFIINMVILIVSYVLAQSINIENVNGIKNRNLLIKQNSELEGKNRELHKLNETQRRLLAVISHDVKNPMDSLSGVVGLVKQNLLNKEELSEIFEQLDSRIRSTSQNVENILNWAKSQSDGIEINPQDFNLKNATITALEFVQPAFNRKKIKVKLDCSKKLEAFGDENAYMTVMRNLISNAYKFTPVGGEINIDCNVVDNMLRISVSDSGIGMPEEKVHNLFKISDSQQGTEGEKGTGLGLLLVNEYTKANNGSIMARSKEGEGSTFIFTIPRSKNFVEDENNIKSSKIMVL